MNALRIAALALLFTLFASPAHAAGDGPGLLWPAVNLAILLAVIIYFARKPVLAFFADRRASIEGDLSRSAEDLSEAEATYAKWQRRLVDLEAELEQIRGAARDRAEGERERILADARATAERIRRDATAAVDQELRRARAELRAEATELAIQIATERLEREVTDADRDRLLDEFIERIESAGNPEAN